MADVGSRKPTDRPDTPQADPDSPASEQLKRDVLTTYKSLGGPEYLKKNPALLDKALLKMIAEPVQKVDAHLTIKIDAPWMNPNRLSYIHELPPAQDIQDQRPKDWRPDKQRTVELIPKPLVEAPVQIANPSTPKAALDALLNGPKK